MMGVGEWDQIQRMWIYFHITQVIMSHSMNLTNYSDFFIK